MATVEPGMVLKSTCPESPLQGIYRVLDVMPDHTQAIVIPVPTAPRKRDGKKQANYYARGFFALDTVVLAGWIDRKLLLPTKIELPLFWALSDEQIEQRYPPRKGKIRSSPLLRRDQKWALIEPLVSSSGNIRLPAFTELDRLASAHAEESGVNKGKVLDALHRYYAFGRIKNALLPNTPNCGAPEKPRYAKEGKKLGRKNAAASVGDTALQGKVLDEQDRQNLQDGWHLYVRPGTTVSQAFIATTQTFYATGHTLKHGLLAPELLPAHMRPTEREFRYHGPKTPEEAAARRLMGEGDWARDYRPLVGSARDGICAVGQVGSLDASPIDVNLTACFDRVTPIGVGRGLVVRDSWLGLYCGFQVAIGGLKTDDAKLAILRSGLDKASLLERYDLQELPPEDFPNIVFSKLLSDNGELRCLSGIESCTEQIGSRIEFVSSKRADRNSTSESGHHSRHRGLDHHLEGTTKGRQRKRGEPLPITKALISHFEYTRLLILWMHWANTQQQVPHLLTTEMRRENIKPTRIEIYRWAKRHGYVSGRTVDPTYLRAHLLPRFHASVQRNGLVLHRPATGNTVELLRNARFNSEHLAASGLYRRLKNADGPPHIEVRADPDDLSEILLVDDRGIHVIPNVSDDLILVHDGCIADLSAINDVEKRRNIETASERDQAASDQRAFREETQANARANKAQRLAAGGRQEPGGRERAGVRANQRRERGAQMEAAAARVPQGDPPANVVSDTPAPQSVSIPSKRAESPEQPGALAALLRRRLAGFHNERHP